MTPRGAVFILALAAWLVTGQEDHCQVDNIDKWDCAPDQASCTAAGCCWVPVTTKVSSGQGQGHTLTSDTAGHPLVLLPGQCAQPLRGR